MKYIKPILLIGFNRPKEIKKVLDKVSLIKPAKLYIAIDGPREGNVRDAEKQAEIRKLVEKIDWAGDVQTRFSKTNRGCKYGVVSAIDWVFENEEEAIILEDDCVPHVSFFTFCEHMLDKYRDVKNVLQIGGTNPLSSVGSSDGYYLSKYNRIWGWATWKECWLNNDPEISFWPEVRKQNILFNIFEEKEAKLWQKIFDDVYDKKIDTWDYQWFLCKLLRGFTVIPEVNLISNVGFGADATHTFNEESHLANLKTGEFLLPKQPRDDFYLDYRRDAEWSKIITASNVSIWSRCINKIRRLIDK
ncbi:glycosyltransferase family 2 protein [Vibrio sp. SM6]|uniref:Glycosyltransferase family 2 protein n=1 Tax=Vibrio agarilyticus TaxID=2726741 RepID=A0A7X8YGY7_9VIBR|nr:glycosyltransferase family 2 protein [Vibrio agarilyticus]NLS13538.1 glycosyltransferase family 2 protein [Vibrio agarilyticus]